MERSKIESLLGFALKARKVKIGVNAVKTIKGKIPLMIIDSTASGNTMDECKEIAAKHGAKVILLSGMLLEDVVHKEHCKLVAVTDGMFAEGILKNTDSHFTLMVEA